MSEFDSYRTCHLTLAVQLYYSFRKRDQNICDLQIITGMCWKGQENEEGRVFFRGRKFFSWLHRCLCLKTFWKIITIFFFSQPESEDIPFCPPIHFHSAHLSLSYTYTHLEESMLLLGKKAYKLNLKILYFNKQYCIQHHPWNKFCLNVANLLWSASKILAYDFGSWFLNFKISKLRIYCNLPVITLIQMH